MLPSCKGSLSWEVDWFWGRISKIIILHLIALKFEQDLRITSLNWETSYFWGQKVKGQLKVKLLKSSISFWKTRTNVSKSHVLKVLSSPEEEQEQEGEEEKKPTTTTSDISSRALIEPLATPVMDDRRSWREKCVYEITIH